MNSKRFRAWDIATKQYITEGWGLRIYLDGGTSYPHNDSEEEARVILEQYTGLKDVAGVEICEGDIVEAKAPPQYPHYDGVYEIQWKEGEARFGVREIEATNEIRHWSCPIEWWHSLVVIGNINEGHEPITV